MHLQVVHPNPRQTVPYFREFNRQSHSPSRRWLARSVLNPPVLSPAGLFQDPRIQGLDVSAFAQRFMFALLCAMAIAMHAHADCIDDAARFHGVHPDLVRAIALQESQMQPGAISLPNSDGTYDIGLMQINSAELPTLAKWGISRGALLNGCVNAYVGSWILSQKIHRLGENWNAIGAYNATTPWKRLVYAQHIYQRLQQLSSPTHPIASRPMRPPVPMRTTRQSGAAHSVNRTSLAVYEASDE